MKYKEFKETIEAVEGLRASNNGTYICVFKQNKGLLAAISGKDEGVCEININRLEEIEDKTDRKRVLQAIAGFANTEISKREQEEKYHWKLRGKWSRSIACGHWISLHKESNKIIMRNTSEREGFETEFTETEFKELAEKFSFPAEAFVKEAID